MLLIAHRSGPDTYPEQTIISAREAFSLGADMVEVDCRPTADGQVAMTHDPNLMRIFGVDKMISDIDASEFKTYRHAADPCFASHMMEDVFRCGLKPLLIHVKDPAVLSALLELIDRYDYVKNVTIGVTLPSDIAKIKAHNPEIKVLAFMHTQADVEISVAQGADYIRLWEEWLAPEIVKEVKDSGCGLWVMSGSIAKKNVGYPSAENLKTILGYQPDGLLINQIRFAKSVINTMD